MIEFLSGPQFFQMVKFGAAELTKNKQKINDLNVFPIPDGDTGDNMSMTINSALSVEPVGSIAETSDAVAHAMLLGARGNSGVILSRIFAGMSKNFATNASASASVSDFFAALESAVAEAYRSVSSPVEGTILSVFRDTVEYCKDNIHKNTSYDNFLEDFTAKFRELLDQTPEQLTILAEANVVDSGAAGLLCIFEGFLKFARGEASAQESSESQIENTNTSLDFAKFSPDDTMEFGYCTEFLLRIQSESALKKSGKSPRAFLFSNFNEKLHDFGDSIVAFQDDTIVKVHIHTFDPGKVLSFAHEFGEFLTIKIENMTLEHHEKIAKTPRKKYGIISVATGSGVKEMFTSIGCDFVIDGGQSTNPSAADFLNSFKEVNADTILVFPNNKNIISTAEQAAKIYIESKVVVIPSATIGEGYAAISMFDESADLEDVIKDATDTMAEVVTGIVAKSSKDTTANGISVHDGDFIGFVDKKVLVSSSKRTTATEALLHELPVSEHEVMLMIYGEDVSDDEAEILLKNLKSIYKNTDIISISGKQPLHDYIFVLF